MMSQIATIGHGKGRAVHVLTQESAQSGLASAAAVRQAVRDP
jgi:hypothetical protein